jgi:hypothetical protein
MFRWILAILFRRIYFTSITEPTDEEYGCIMDGYRDRHNRIKITKVKYIEPERIGISDNRL